MSSTSINVMNRNLRIFLAAWLLALTTAVHSYENQCAAVFLNGLESHTAGKIRFGSYSSMLGGSPRLAAGEVSQFWNSSTCGPNIKCQATGFPSAKFADFTPYSEWSTSLWGHQGYPNLIVGFNDSEEYTADSAVRLEDMTLLSFGELKLYPGDYWLDELYVGMNARLVLAAPGQVRIFAREIDVNPYGYIGDSDFPFLIYSGDAEYSFGSSADVFHYSEKRIDIDSFVVIRGSLSANDIDLDIDSQVYYESAKSKKINFGSICDYDRDGIYDGIDEDSDNDGVSDELELQAGTDIYDADSFPADTDGDGVIDIIDEDIDNDGYSNQEEIDSGSDPYDPTSVPLLLTLGQQSGETVYNNLYQLSGLVSAGELNRIQLAVTINENTWAPIINASGYFSQEIKLRTGPNFISVTAMDDLGNRVDKSLEVTFTPPFSIVSITPETGSTQMGLDQEFTVTVLVEDGDAPQVTINSQPTTRSEVSEGSYAYEAVLTLLPGENTVSVQAVGNGWSVNQSVSIRVEPEDPDEYPSPEFIRVQPDNDSRTAASEIAIYAEVNSRVGRLSATINGDDTDVSSRGQGDYVIQTTYPLESGSNSIVIDVVDALGQISTHSVIVNRDNEAPIIELTSPWQLPPVINELPTPALTIEGRLVGDDVKSLRINGSNVSLTEAAGGYSFSQNLVVTPLAESYVELVAKDDLGNAEHLGLSFYAATALELQWLTPQFPVTWYSEQGTGYPFALQVTGATGSEIYNAMLVPGDIPVELTKIGTDTVTGTLPSQLVKGDYDLVVAATSGAYQTQLIGAISVLDLADIPLEIIGTEPELNGSGYEPDTAIVVNFNRPVDPQSISFDVKRTLHGKTYVNNDKSGVEFFNAKGAVLEELHVAREQVSGGLSFIKGNRTVIFYPQNDLGYDADVYWELYHHDTSIGRFAFETRELPTFINGGVIDSLGQIRAGVTVHIEELNIMATTDSDGVFNFGYQTTADKNIPEGEYTFVVNRDRKVPTLGEARISGLINGGELNTLPLFKIPNIDLTIPSVPYRPGVSELWLAAGAVKLTLSETGLAIPGNEDVLHTQFVPVSAGVRSVANGLATFWLYQTQPFGVRPIDPVELEIDLPRYRGTYNYIGGENRVNYKVLIVAYNPESDQIEPVGVGTITGTKLSSVGAINLPSLDYVGYASALAIHQIYFDQYLNEEISFQELVFRISTERPE